MANDATGTRTLVDDLPHDGGTAACGERFASALAVRRRATIRKVGNRIEEGVSLHSNVDLLDLWHQRPHTAENEGFATPFSCTFCIRSV
jgi:hypothetical protein